MLKTLILTVIGCLSMAVTTAAAQETKAKPENSQPVKKANRRPVVQAAAVGLNEPYAKASVESMKTQCVRLDTEAGVIELEMFPESAPESVRSFLNLAATGALNTTTFSRVVPGFIVQGGDFSTRAKLTPELAKRSRRTLPDEPSLIKHERGILSMARSDEPNSATTNFFILVREAPHLDGKFAAFGRVTGGMEIVDAINKMPVTGDKPTKPIILKQTAVQPCPAQTNP